VFEQARHVIVIRLESNDKNSKMFKRARRRIEKSEREHELGLTPEAKEAFGLHDTDSDESLSESGSESNGSERPPRKRKRPLEPEDDGEDGDGGESDPRGGAPEGGAEAEEGSEPPDAGGGGSDDRTDAAECGLTVESVLNDPFYFVSEDQQQQACAVCPGKRLKNEHMAELHVGAMVSPKMHPMRLCLKEGF
jgi:hypothetical protein